MVQASEGAILVVGAGPVGLMMACELIRHGVSCRIIDGKTGPTPLNESRALAIQARTMELFHELGVASEVVERARLLNGLSAFSGSSRIAHMTLDYEDFETRYPHIYCLPQSNTERILLARLQALGRNVEWGTSLETFTQDEREAAATLKTTDGASHAAKFAWIVGCDGARSVVRKTLSLGFEGGEYEEKFLLADVTIDWAIPVPDDEIILFLTPETILPAFPLPEAGRWRLVDTSGRMEGEDAQGITAHFRDNIHKYVSPGAKVDNPTWTSSFRIHHRVVGAYREGRAFVAGDAAHLHSPAGGQGMNTGIQDAYNLGWKLALVVQGKAPESLLESYSIERKTAAMGVLTGADRLTRFATLRNPLVKGIRDKLLGMLSHFEFVRRKAAHEVSELGVNYRTSPIVSEDHATLLQALVHPSGETSMNDVYEFAKGPHPGDRAPDVEWNGGGSRLYDAKHPTLHTLFLFQGRDEDAAKLKPAADVVKADFSAVVHPVFVACGSTDWTETEGLIDSESTIHDRYGVSTSCLYLMRPDGYIGYRSMPADAQALKAYLGRFFAKV